MGLKPIIWLLSNLKTVYNKLELLKNESEQKRSSMTTQILTRQRDLASVDEKMISELISYFQITVGPELEDNIKVHIRQLLKYSIDLEQKRTVLTNLIDSGHITMSKFDEQLESIKDRISKKTSVLKNILKAEAHLLNRHKELSTKVSNLSNIEILRSHQDEYRKQLKDCVKEIIKNGGRLSLSPEEIEASIQSHNRIRNKTGYALTYFEQFIELLHDKQQIPKDIINHEDDLQRKIRSLSRLKKANGRYARLSTNDAVLGDISRVIESMEFVLSYSQSQDNKGICPICSSNHGEKLPSLIKGNIEHATRFFGEKRAWMTKLSEHTAIVRKKIDECEREIWQQRAAINTLSDKNEQSKRALESIRDNDDFDINTFSQTKETLLIDKSKLDEKISNQMKLKGLLVNFQNVKPQYIRIRDEIRSHQGDTNSREALEKRLIMLERLKKRLGKKLTRFKSFLCILNERNIQLLTKRNEYANKIEQEETHTEFSQLMKNTNLSITGVRADMDKLDILTIENQKMKLNVTVNSDLAKFKQQRTKCELEFQKIHKLTESVLQQLEAIYANFGQQAMDFVNKPESSIQRFYRYLNPVPSADTTVYFSTNQEELNIFLKNDGGLIENARFTMSSAQLNVLAISIFLAINEAQTITNLDLVAIDDPIQNMDDVNQFSLCDIFSTLDKPLILSTHSLDFVKLFFKKNEHRKEKIRVYVLKSAFLTPDKIDTIDFDQSAI